jgi:hypothetical protein
VITVGNVSTLCNLFGLDLCEPLVPDLLFVMQLPSLLNMQLEPTVVSIDRLDIVLEAKGEMKHHSSPNRCFYFAPFFSSLCGTTEKLFRL